MLSGQAVSYLFIIVRRSRCISPSQEDDCDSGLVIVVDQRESDSCPTRRTGCPPIGSNAYEMEVRPFMTCTVSLDMFISWFTFWRKRGTKEKYISKHKPSSNRTDACAATVTEWHTSVRGASFVLVFVGDTGLSFDPKDPSPCLVLACLSH